MVIVLLQFLLGAQEAPHRQEAGHACPIAYTDRMESADRPEWAECMRRERLARGWPQSDAVHAMRTFSTVPLPDGLLDQWKRWERGRNKPDEFYRPLIAATFGTVVEALTPTDDEATALELARRVAASDVGDDTLTQLELAFDDLAVAYPATPPLELLKRLQVQLSYVASLIDARKTLDEHRRLIVVGAWLSLLAATVHVDLKQPIAATTRLRTAASLARHADHDEIRAWVFETEAWRRLTDGEYCRALELSRSAQELAPAGSSVAIQAIAQEGRAWARLGQPRESYAAIESVNKLVSPLKRPERPQHHYRYDPDKSVSYTATTLAWLGDPAAETYAREVIARVQPVQPHEDVGKWPRRVATANLDLALALLVNNRLDEACDAAQRAIASGRVVPSSHWRAAEIVTAVEARQLPEASDLREAYQDLKKGAG
jgi:tetratricopeptide (TPR) repeat protein